MNLQGGDQIAVVTNTDDVLIGDPPDQPPTRIVHGARMLRPQFGRSTEQELWTVSDDGIQLVHPNGGVTPVQAQLPGRITAFRLSPGSVRMAVVLEINGQSVLGMVRSIAVPPFRCWRSSGP